MLCFRTSSLNLLAARLAQKPERSRRHPVPGKACGGVIVVGGLGGWGRSGGGEEERTYKRRWNIAAHKSFTSENIKNLY
jgi:hypothetical protein